MHSAFHPMIAVAMVAAPPVSNPPSAAQSVTATPAWLVQSKGAGCAARSASGEFVIFISPGVDEAVLARRLGAQVMSTDRPISVRVDGRDVPFRSSAVGSDEGAPVAIMRAPRDTLGMSPASRVAMTDEAGATREFPALDDRARRELKTCERRRLVEWGAPAAIVNAVDRPAWFQGQSWFVDGDYPRSALSEAREGKATAILGLDAVGKPFDCWIVESSGSPDLDLQTCKVALARGRGKPALDISGQPVASYGAMTIRWMLGN